MNGIREAEMELAMLLPHEVLHNLGSCNANLAFKSIMLGNTEPDAVKQFWEHVRKLGPWRDHPDLQDATQDFSCLIPFQFHADGCEVYRDDEYFIYSFSSLFGGSGLVADVMLYRFRLCIIGERHMKDPRVPRLRFKEDVQVMVWFFRHSSFRA